MNTLVVVLASRGITLLSSLLEELQVEGLLTDLEDRHSSVGSDFSVNSRCSAWKRVTKLMDELPLLNYLFAQFSTLYKMVRHTNPLNPFPPTIGRHILHSVLYAFPLVLTRRICLTVRDLILKLVIISFILMTFIFYSKVIL